MRKEELADRLWVSSRTIDSDLARLSLDSNDPLDVMGQRLAVDMKRSKRKFEFPSKVHPFFLTFNLTQVIVTLEGLKVMSEKPGWRLYAVKTAQVVWKQLSKTARARIREVSEIMSLDMKWYEGLNDDADNNLFLDEWMCSDSNDANSIMLCFKNGLKCDIQYRNDEGKDVIYLNCKILRYDGEMINIKMDEEVVEMKIEQIVASKSSTSLKKDLNYKRDN